ncbi:Serine/threonine protein kinase [Methylorubrum extorquens]|uniref:Serine/threonine protein kinase n=1 Tax=Methylorubrum extorquens TaxID=408 RepID=A0A2N9AHK1_METEX|nr:serine/threonine protein kinase [Methylorubrum zatmanii]ARO54211.1 serine/threonine protein kinase [Methylorubrum zatmanii]SOR26662.1 Serine/threonine protein kinase [Methylorubrum extorquens]
MRPVTLLSVALAGLLWAAAPAGAAPPGDGAAGQPQGQSQGQSQGPLQGQVQGPPHGAAPAPPQAAPAARPPGAGMRASERRRRISYAACNRESHRRRLSGGARRRFLVRCRLGYERRPASQPAPARRP